MVTSTLFFAFSFVFAFSLILVLRPIAQNIGLVDYPCSRKQHTGEVPLVGGLAIYVTITFCSFFITPFDSHYQIFLISTSFMVLMGALDDFHDLNANLRLIAQCLIGSLMVFGADLQIEKLGNLFGMGGVELGTLGALFTILAAITCINAFNMTDGVDGLVGVLSLNTFLSLAILAFISGVPFDTSITSVLAGAIFAFLFFNMGWFKRGRYKVFMGDAGSMLIGLTVIWLVTFMVKVDMIRAVTVVWLIAIPLMDMFSVMMRRMLAGNSPLTASRDHFHHLFLRKGFSSSKTTTLIGIINALFCLVGIMSEIYVLPEYIMTGLFMIFFLVYNALVVREFERMN